ncbi:MAG: exodeoxyribonuclease VII small subunit [Chromatiales bacterium]|nr:exodeoxyribonuclease VII small subunit [Chromatiales bacterium]
MARKKASNTFEQSLAELEQLVEAMESGELSLEDSLKSFERGVELTRNCHQALKEAEQKVQILSSNQDNAELENFSSDQ